MQLRRPRHESIDVDAYDAAFAELSTIREAHESCTESPLDCRAGILWATNTTLLALDLDGVPVRSLLLEHASAINEMLDRRTGGRIATLMVVGRRLEVATSARFH